ncbi:uncharacterized protein METZ01_LOCUS297325, partial [marine metagenome]
MIDFAKRTGIVTAVLMTLSRWILMAAFLWPFSLALAEERVQGRRSLVLENDNTRLVLDIAGGSIPEFRFR